jgi:hypothetical protein
MQRSKGKDMRKKIKDLEKGDNVIARMDEWGLVVGPTYGNRSHD